MTKIIGFSGKKQAGKNAAANQLIAIELRQIGVVQGKAIITPKGEILVTDLMGQDGDNYPGILDLNRQDDAMLSFKYQHIDPYVKCYSFADLLKQDVCVNIFGLKHEQCYGTDEQKNTKTHLRWEDMPGVITEMLPEVEDDEVEEIAGRLGPYYQKLRNGVVYHRPGPMTGREVMQFVGTEIFRKMSGNVWAEALTRRINIEQPMVALITDVRFPNEVKAVQDAGGTVVRFTRDIFKGQDQHPSEVALDKDKYDWANFDIVIDNEDMNLLEQMEALYMALVKEGLYDAPKIIDEKQFV